MRLSPLLLVSILLGASCGSPTGPAGAPSPGATDSASASGTALPSAAQPSATATLASPTPDVGATAGLSAEPVLGTGTGATAVVDSVRVRSEPSVDDASVKYTPLQPRGSNLFVIDGPVVGSGYDWWQVIPTEFTGLSGPGYGWVAAASREGERWIEAKALDCPLPPKDVSALASLADGIALACFGRIPITVRARLVPCNCDVDGQGTKPDWLGLADQPILLVEPSDTGPPARTEDWFTLQLDPEAGVSPIPTGQVVEVTGFFDHPAAQGCLVGGRNDAPWSPSLSCRFAFAVTELKVVEP